MPLPTSISSNSSDRFFCQAASLKEAEFIRKGLVTISLNGDTPRGVFYVMQDPNSHERYNMFVSNEWGGHPSEEYVATVSEHSANFRSEYRAAKATPS